MPLLGTRGAASAKGFGFTNLTAVAGFKFVGLQSSATNSAIKGSTPLTLTGFSTQPPFSSGARFPGIIADGQFIVVGNAAYSTNNGASWSTNVSQGSQLNYQQRTPSNLNGIICYNPTSKRAFSPDFAYNSKTNNYIARVVSINNSGSLAIASTNTGSGTNVTNVLYASALNAVYLTALGSSANNHLVVNSSSGTSIQVTSTGQSSSYRYGVSNDNYVLGAAYAGFGTTFYLRKYTSQDLSSYTQYGTISPYISASMTSGYVWCPVNNKYFFVASGGSTTIYSADLSTPQNLTRVGDFTISGFVYAATVGILEDATGVLYVFGEYYFSQPKGGSAPSSFMFRSLDGGVSWTNTGIPVFNLTKNFST
jgi:hypothetical protein